MIGLLLVGPKRVSKAQGVSLQPCLKFLGVYSRRQSFLAGHLVMQIQQYLELLYMIEQLL